MKGDQRLWINHSKLQRTEGRHRFILTAPHFKLKAWHSLSKIDLGHRTARQANLRPPLLKDAPMLEPHQTLIVRKRLRDESPHKAKVGSGQFQRDH